MRFGMLTAWITAVWPLNVAHAGDHSALLNALDASNFWAAEDKGNVVALRAKVERSGIHGLLGSRRYVSLDPEALAEEGVLEALSEVLPSLQMRGATIHSMSTVKSDGFNYEVEVNGKHYVAYSGEEVDDSWGLATETLFRIVNDILPQECADRFYAISGDGTEAMFLPREVVPFFDELSPYERPYIPDRAPPNFGATFE